MEINGIAHTVLTVKRFEASVAFYDSLLPRMGLKRVFRGNDACYWVGARTGLAIQKSNNPAQSGEFSQDHVGLHHLCFRARSREDVDTIAKHLTEMKAKIVRGPQEGTWAPGYYYVLFEDPDGIRLEVNHVPGKGVLADGADFNPGQDYK